MEGVSPSVRKSDSGGHFCRIGVSRQGLGPLPSTNSLAEDNVTRLSYWF